MENRQIVASHQNFHVIAHDLDEKGNLKAACKEKLGVGVRLADWNDLVAYHEAGGSLSELIANLKIPIEAPNSPQYRISMNGKLLWQGRHYFVARHDHTKREGFLAHDNIDGYHLTLGSWFGKGGFVLCYGDPDSTVPPAEPAVITPSRDASKTDEMTAKPDNTDIPENLQQIVEKALTDSVVCLVWQKMDEETGEPLIWPRASGFFVAPNIIVTNIHCVTDAPSVFAEIVSTKTEFPVEGVVAFDAENDLVILKVAGEGVPLPLDDSNTVQVGETVCAVGHPRAKEGEATQVTISGIQNSRKRLEIKEEFDPGSSGSAILNDSGKVIGVAVGGGMATSGLGNLSRGYTSYAIPVRTLVDLLANMVEVEPFTEWQKRPLVRAYTEIRQGETELQQGNHRESLACFDTALELNPNLADAYLNRAAVNLFLGHYKEAITDCDNALRLNPDLVLAYINRATAKTFLEEAEEAIDDYNAVLELNPDFAIVYNNRAMANISLKRYKEAIADCDSALKLDPNLVQSYICRAMARSALKQNETALADFDIALKLAPDSVEIYFARAHFKFALKDYAGTIEDYDKIVGLNPELGASLNVYGHRADAKYYLRDYEGAIEDYDKVIQLNPKSETAYYDRGRAKYNFGKSKADQGKIVEAQVDYQGAVEDYTEAIKLDPEYASVYNSRGWIKYLLGQFNHERGDTAEARKLFEAAVTDSDEAIRLRQDNPSSASYHTRAAAKAALGAYPEAIEDFNETILMKPDEARYYYDRGLAKQAFGQHAAAKTDFQKAKDLDPDVENKPF
ncbi:MAG: tetratricopeptide repeat protein [Candidatus Poribacteria bacterium]|nr:tetratricopeptide repeat protein [Candidatus Poribacteria bacterium]